jgi:hypothetical protein
VVTALDSYETSRKTCFLPEAFRLYQITFAQSQPMMNPKAGANIATQVTSRIVTKRTSEFSKGSTEQWHAGSTRLYPV